MIDYLNQALFGFYPYIALSVFLIGSAVRFDREQYTWRSGSSQLLRRCLLFVGSNFFHSLSKIGPEERDHTKRGDLDKVKQKELVKVIIFPRQSEECDDRCDHHNKKTVTVLPPHGYPFR